MNQSHPNPKAFCWLIVASFLFCFTTLTFAAPPNIVFIYADDLGYGDVSCNGATRVKTPNIDKLAVQGLRFTDAHASTATCTPSRYSLMTGEYAWRQKGTGILPGNASLIIKPGRYTLPAMLKKAGYNTAAVGKWHLGLGDGNLDWNRDIKPGPLEIGFDYCFLIPATGDRVPCVYVENHRVVNHDPNDPILVDYDKEIGDEPTGRAHPELLKLKTSHGHDQTIVNGISRIGYMKGGKSARWVDEDIADVITGKALSFIEKNKDKPFFLYFSTHDIHVPRVPHARFKGTSQCGVRGDVTQEFDWCVGEIAAALDRLDLATNTLVIVTSDNGPVVDDGYADGAVKDLNGHNPSGPLRGGKYSLYEGGTRVPFIARWPGRIKPGVSDALVCQIDLLASFAHLAGQSLPGDAAPDSFDTLAAFLGDSRTGRTELVEQGSKGLGLRQGDWKYLLEVGVVKGRANAVPKNPKKAAGELYDLSHDLAEAKDLAQQNPNQLKKLADKLQQIQQHASRPGFGASK